MAFYHCHDCGRRSRECGEGYRCRFCESGFVERMDNGNEGGGAPHRLDEFLALRHQMRILDDPRNRRLDLAFDGVLQALNRARDRRGQGQGDQGQGGLVDAQQGRQEGQQDARVLRNLLIDGFVLPVFDDFENADIELHDGLDAVRVERGGRGRRGVRPMEREEIDRLPTVTVEQARIEGAGGEGLQCTICLDGLKLGDAVVELSCRHIFHRVCIEPWLLQQNTCPFCRKHLVAPHANEDEEDEGSDYSSDDDEDPEGHFSDGEFDLDDLEGGGSGEDGNSDGSNHEEGGDGNNATDGG